MTTVSELIQLAQDKLAIALAADPATFKYRVGNKTVDKCCYIEMLTKTISTLSLQVEPDFDVAQFDVCTGDAGQDCAEYLL